MSSWLRHWLASQRFTCLLKRAAITATTTGTAKVPIAVTAADSATRSIFTPFVTVHRWSFEMATGYRSDERPASHPTRPTQDLDSRPDPRRPRLPRKVGRQRLGVQ